LLYNAATMAAMRTIWILNNGRPGDVAQLRHLVHLLQQDKSSSHWDYSEKRLAFGSGTRLTPGLVEWTLDWRGSGLSGADWPDAVIAAGRSAGWIGAAIKRRSKGATRLIMLGRMNGDPARCDLVLATAQFPVARGSNTVMLPVPLAPAPAVEPDLRATLNEALAGQPRPWTLWAIGGGVPPHRLDAAACAALAGEASRLAASESGTALVFTSPRTGAANEGALRGALSSGAYFQGWQNRTGPNLFPAAVAAADRMVVTSDSISMVVEGIAAGKPVALYTLPQFKTLALRLGRSLDEPRGLFRVARPLIRRGIIESPPDRQAFFDTLIASGWLAAYPSFPRPSGEPPLPRAEKLAVAAVQRLLA
jgi:mitochondrial fission protein ELM1